MRELSESELETVVGGDDFGGGYDGGSYDSYGGDYSSGSDYSSGGDYGGSSSDSYSSDSSSSDSSDSNSGSSDSYSSDSNSGSSDSYSSDSNSGSSDSYSGTSDSYSGSSDSYTSDSYSSDSNSASSDSYSSDSYSSDSNSGSSDYYGSSQSDTGADTSASTGSDVTASAGPSTMDIETGGASTPPDGQNVQTFDDGSELVTNADGSTYANEAPADPASAAQVDPGPSTMDIETGGAATPQPDQNVQTFDDGSQLVTNADGSTYAVDAPADPTPRAEVDPGPSTMDIETGGAATPPPGQTVQTFDDGSQLVTNADGTSYAVDAPADPTPRAEVDPGPSTMDIETGGVGDPGGPGGPEPQVTRFDDGSTLTIHPDGTTTATPALGTPHTQVFDDGSTLTTGPYGQLSATPATGTPGPAGVQNGSFTDGTYYGPPPTFTGDYNADLASNRAAAEQWAQERLDRGINTVGPEGQEQNLGFGALAALGGPQAQYFAAVHDVQGSEAYVQAMYSGNLDAYNAALRESAIAGYLTNGGAAGAERAAEIWAAHGFTVSGPSQVNITPPAPTPSPSIGDIQAP